MSDSMTSLARARMGRESGEVMVSLDALSHSTAEAIADPQESTQTRGATPITRRMAQVTAVNLGPPLTVNLDVDGVAIPGASPIFDYFPRVGDWVWLYFAGPADAHVFPPITTTATRAWKPLTLQGGWTVYGGGYAPPGYWQDASGFVHLRGAAGSSTSGIIAVLPTGYRPPFIFDFVCNVLVGGSFVPFPVVVFATGEVYYAGPTNPTAVHLNQISFRLD